MDVADWVVCVPVIAPRSETAAARATWDVDAPNLLVVDNTPGGDYADGPWRYHHEGRNLGVAASWNKGIALGKEFTVFMSSYLVLDEGLARTVERMIEAANDYGCLTWQACHAWGFTRKTFEVAGTFDERFRVAYHEDAEFIRRLEVTGCHSAANPMPKIAVPGSCPQARSIHLGLAAPPMQANHDRLVAKWGGVYPDFTFEHPWNDPSIDIRDWDRDGP